MSATDQTTKVNLAVIVHRANREAEIVLLTQDRKEANDVAETTARELLTLGDTAALVLDPGTIVKVYTESASFTAEVKVTMKCVGES